MKGDMSQHSDVETVLDLNIDDKYGQHTRTCYYYINKSSYVDFHSICWWTPYFRESTVIVLGFCCHQMTFCHASDQNSSTVIIRRPEINSEKATEGHQDITQQPRNTANPDVNPSESNLLKFIWSIFVWWPTLICHFYAKKSLKHQNVY